MTTKSPFKIQPVKRYRNAVYGSESGESILGRACWLAWNFPKKIVRGAVTLLLVAGLALGAGCENDSTSVSRWSPDLQGDLDAELEEGVENEESAYVETMGVMAECTSGDIACLDARTANVCEDSFYTQYNCDQYCEDTFGEGFVSDGCDASQADDFCTCVQEVCPEDGPVACDENGNLVTCEEGEEKTVSCWDECPPYSEEDASKMLVEAVCDETSEGFCYCRYDTFDGGMYECYPDEKQCLDDATLLICNENYSFDPMSCEEYCQEKFGPDYISLGCNIEAQDPCQCEYGLTPGIVAECTPGDIYCPDAQHVAICEEGHLMHTIYACEDYCRITFGEDYYSTMDCNAENPGNPCSCEYGIIDGDMADVPPSTLRKTKR